MNSANTVAGTTVRFLSSLGCAPAAGTEPDAMSAAEHERLTGAEIVFDARPGMTAEWLQRVVDCHLARNAAIGFDTASADMPYCPLAVRGARAQVTSVGDGFAVDVTADDPASVGEIVRRADLLHPGT